MHCFLVPPGFWDMADAQDAVEHLRPAHNIRPGRFVSVDLVEVEAVAGDGNCLFEAAHRGLQQLWGDESPSLDSKSLRASVVNYIAAHPRGLHNGLTLSEWLAHERHLSPAEYKHM